MQQSELEIYQRAMNEVANVLTTDSKGNIIYVNDKYCKLTNYTREELIGRNNRIFKSGYHSREFYDAMYKELNNGNIFKTTFKNKAKDNSFFWADTTIIPVLDENNVPYQFFMVLFDITSQITDYEQKEEYLIELSHEIRTPLHGLLSMVDLLSGTNLSGEQKNYIKHIKETSTHLGHLITELLIDFRIKSGKIQFESVPLDINHLIISLVELFSYKETNKDIKYSHSIDQNIQSNLLGDPTRLRQILFNLLDNSVRFTEKGTIIIQAKSVDESSDNQTIEFQTINTSIDISKEKKKKIFEQLTQAKGKENRLYGDTGMSMNIVQKLIELQNGTYGYDIIEGTGSVFTFRISFKKDTKNLEHTSVPADLPGLQPVQYKILIAEDDKINQLIYKKQMSKFGYICKMADDGFETLKLLQQESFDLLLLDMQMPGMNGDEVLRKIRNEFSGSVRHIPVICISATVHPSVINSLIEAGADAYLTKPYKESELTEIINKILSTIKPERERYPEEKLPDQTTFINLEPLNLFANGDVDFILEILEYFKSTTPGVLESMQQNFNTSNAELARQLHKYRSQVSLLGLTELTELTLTLETILIEITDFEPHRNDFEKLLSQSRNILVEVAQLITKLKADKTS